MMATPASRQRMAKIGAGICLPVLAAGYQLAAVEIAHGGQGAASWRAWAQLAIRTPWTPALLLIEGATFLLWMLVLGELPLALAYPLTATGSVLSLALAVLGLGEVVPPLAWAGTAAILGGAWLVVRPR